MGQDLMASHSAEWEDELSAYQAKTDLHSFVKQAWHIVEPEHEFVDGWHIRALCKHLEAVRFGHILNLLVNMPPACSKSLIICVLWPIWVWITWPTSCWLFAAYQQGLSSFHSLKRRQLLDSPWFRARWGREIQFSKEQKQKTEFQNTRGGWMLATSVRGRGTGTHPNFIISDDPNDVNTVESKIQRESVNDWWDGVITTRGMTRKVRQVVQQQRTHQQDLSGHIQATGKDWTQIILPMRYEPDRMETTSLGWNDERTTEGELLWPEMIDEEKVQELESRLLHRAAGQLQQRPAPRGGSIFKESYFRYYHEEMVQLDGEAEIVYVLRDDEGGERRILKRDCSLWFQTVDTALKEGQENNYTVVLTAILTPPPTCMLVEHVHRERLPVPKQFGMLIQARARFPLVTFQAVEEAASGIGLIQEGRMRGVPFHPLKCDRSKLARAMPVGTAYKNGLVYHKAGEAWLAAFEDELLNFPTGEFDDQVDGVSHAGIIMQQHSYAGLMEDAELTCWPPRRNADEQDEELPDGDGRQVSLAERLTGRQPGREERWTD